jgi:hypothetical protein
MAVKRFVGLSQTNTINISDFRFRAKVYDFAEPNCLAGQKPKSCLDRVFYFRLARFATSRGSVFRFETPSSKVDYCTQGLSKKLHIGTGCNFNGNVSFQTELSILDTHAGK